MNLRKNFQRQKDFKENISKNAVWKLKAAWPGNNEKFSPGLIKDQSKLS
jgi:hypothetical protein